MASSVKATFMAKLIKDYGPIRKLGASQSLYEISNGMARVYIRYSTIHGRNQTFYGLRERDLQQLEGFASMLCFLWDDQAEPLIIPFAEFEEIFKSTKPAGDGQYKVMIYLDEDATELYIAQAGRFNVEGYFGWAVIDSLVDSVTYDSAPLLSHSQVQTLLGAIGIAKGYDVWIPQNDRIRLDWSVAYRFECRSILPFGFDKVESVLQEIDVIWITRGSSELTALFEVEHSTPIYSGLLRFNDIHLVAPFLRPRFTVVSNEVRRALFVRQLNRPTFQTSGLSNLCTFLEYVNVFAWHRRIWQNLKEEKNAG